MPAPTTPLQDLFTYGSLMCEDIMTTVVGAQLPCTPAILPGYRRFLVKGEQYPGVTADVSGSVAGMVYHNISLEGWLRLDRFEGAMYNRSPVIVHFANGTERLVYCYLFRPEFFDRLTAIEWDYDTFLRNGKALFQKQYCGFKAID
jgi:gamma-glutamylcyclotransferase (GGCT)/AIG2-like uncharacterized protein YtfP